jgi:hypothetical protein
MAYFHLLFPAALALSGLFVCAAQSCTRPLFVSILEADSYQSVVYCASAFSRVAELPLAHDLINTTLAENLVLPSFNGLSRRNVRIVQTVEPSRPSPRKPPNVAVIPLVDTWTPSSPPCGRLRPHVQRGDIRLSKAPRTPTSHSASP